LRAHARRHQRPVSEQQGRCNTVRPESCNPARSGSRILIRNPADFPGKLATSIYSIKVRTCYQRHIGEFVLLAPIATTLTLGVYHA
jgi:hypothetical protein